jgi:carbonic anhydrase/acetyltransferase-like protein (isoleucine patch superfamily)
MLLIPFCGVEPKLAEDVFVAEGAVIIGDVEIGESSSIWFGVIVRGDVHSIRIGKNTNIQDGSVLHVGRDGFPLTIGDEVVVGHHVMLHGCTIGDRSLIGIGSRILNGAVIGEESIVAAGAVVVEGTECPPRTLLAGVPAKPRREVRPDEIERTLLMVRRYKRLAEIYRGREKDLGDL